MPDVSLSSPAARPGQPNEAPQRMGLGALLAALVALGYYGFLLTGAFLPQALARPAFGHVPWSFVWGAGLLAGAVAATGIYVLAANAADSRAGAGA